MQYFIGIDGGGSKTQGLLSDHCGNILSECTLGGSNHQICGPSKTRAVIGELIIRLVQSAGISIGQLTFVELALAGADMDSDFALLSSLIAPLLDKVPFEIVNDAWGLQRSGLRQHWGGVSICGTGANAGVVSPDGKRYILRALSYTAGGGGGGHDMALEALHYMFRADERTYKPTLLTQALPEALGYKSPSDMLCKLYPEELFTREELNLIPPLLFSLARQNDPVSLEILMRQGQLQGQMMGGVITQSNSQSLQLPIVLGGSIFKGDHPAFIEAMKKEVLKVAPGATFVQSHYPPAAGSLLLAMENAELPMNESIYNALDDYWLPDSHSDK